MLEVREIYKKYGKKPILQGVTFQAKAGECIGIVGGNGCGKTTLLSILAGVNRPDRGSICFDGTEAVGTRKVFERYAAYVPQENPLIPELSARDNYRLWFRGEKKRMEEDLNTGVGRRLGLAEFLSTPAGKVMILDEPGAALDLAAKEEILRYIREYTAQGGLVVLTSHEMTELSVCTRLFLLRAGVLVPIRAGSSAEELIAQF